MSKQLKHYKAVRGSYKGHCTQDLKRADRIMTDAEQNVTELRAIIGRLSRRMDEIADFDNKILNELEEEDDLAQETDQALTFQDTIQFAIMRMNDFIGSKQPSVSPFHFTSPDGSKFKVHKSHINLPKLHIQPFDGNPREWLTFWDSFNNAVHEHDDLSPIDKMNYLKGLIKGDAAGAISGLPTTSQNYEKAIEMLTQRFGRKQVLINAHMESLSNIGNPTTDTNRLRKFYDECESNIRALETLEVKTESYGNLLIPILLKKLPEELRCAIIRANSDAFSSLNELRTTLRKEIETRENSQLIKEDDTAEATDDVMVPAASALFTKSYEHKAQRSHSQQKTQRVQEPRPCIYCNENHRPDKCTTAKSAEQRRRILGQKRRCFNCLRSGHTKYQCRSKGRCLNCGLKHHTSICEPNATNKDSDKPPEKQEAKTGNTEESNTLSATTYTNALLQTAMVTAIGPTAQCRARILVDTGSQRTFITQHLKNELQLKAIEHIVLDINTFGTTESTTKTYEVVTLSLKAEKETVNMSALVTPIICPPLSNSIQQNMIPREFKTLKIADSVQETDKQNVDILVGNDNYAQIMIGNTKKSRDERWMATECKFGWLLSGPTSNSTDKTLSTICQESNGQTLNDSELNDTLKKFWEISKVPEECDDNATDVHRHFQETITFNSETKRYNVRLPWKDNKHDLPTNFTLAKKRLNSLQHTLKKKDPELIQKYHKQLLDQLHRGFIEEVLDPSEHESTVHYIPHFPVFKESTTTAMRIVYDASAQATPQTPCLNDCLHTGPNLMQQLEGILLKFRLHKVAFIADIEKAFLQIELNTEDRDATRFLWLKDINRSANNPNNLITYRFCRVLFGAAPSPYLLNATIQHHLTNEGSWVSNDLQQSIYMDNVVTGTDSEAKAIQYYTTSRNNFNKANMNLRQWTSNCTTLNAKAQSDKVNAELTVKVLGLEWNAETDTLSLSLSKLCEQIRNTKEFTKRFVLSLSSKLFDPLGFTEPVSVKAKIMIQELWKANIDWDEHLPQNHKEDWTKWLNELHYMIPLTVPRQYIKETMTNIQLHIFCDSSQLAYGTVAYIRCITTNGVKCAFIMSKSKVAPIKQQTLPRLELLGTFLGAKLSDYLSKNTLQSVHPFETIMWSDSQIALSWISSTKVQRQAYIRSRVQLIKELTPQVTWRHCPSAQNPADLVTRGLNGRCFIQKEKEWLQGPYWLSLPPEKWPHTINIEERQTIEAEDNIMETNTNVFKTQETFSLLNVINIEKYNNLNKLLRVTALVKKFANTIRKQINAKETTTTMDIKDAHEHIIKSVQQTCLRDVITYLERKDKTKSKHPPIVSQLGLYLDEQNILRCKGRLQYAKLPYDAKFPVLIPKEHHLATLIVRNTHNTVMHGGVRETLTQLRQKYWIPQGRQLIKKELKKCVTCRKVEGPPFRSVTPPPLPEVRVDALEPFQITGVDYAGPLYVRNIKKENVKVYICLFTCATIRAIHLELVEDQTSGAFIRAFKRFISRRGIPECVISDNSKTFKAGSKELLTLKTQILKTAESQRFLANKGIQWRFITERAPWWGGFYERLVGSVKRRLKKTLGKTSLNMIELQTILTEVEATLNSRPLTFPYTDINDGQPLTPSHFLCGHRLLNLPDTGNSEEDPEYDPGASSSDLTRRENYHRIMMQNYWKLWQKEYLTSLREQHSSVKTKRISGETVAEGKVVLIHDDTRRNQWKLGIITKLHRGKDGLIRSVSLKTAKGSYLSRPIEKLYPIEVSTDEFQHKDTDPVQKEEETARSPRPIRSAARRAAQRIKELSQFD